MRGYRIYRLIWFSTLVSTLIVICGYTLPFSPLYGLFNDEASTLDKANRFNEVRYKKALDYFENEVHRTTELHKSLSPVVLKNEAFDIISVIVTVARKGASVSGQQGYLIQTAAAMDAAINLDNEKSRVERNKALSAYEIHRHLEPSYAQTTNLKKLVIVCNADNNPGQHEEAVFLQKHLLYVNKKESSIIGADNSKTFKLLNSDLTDSKRRKEIEDYMFCMNAVSHIKTRYVLMLEDDVIPVKTLFSVIEHTIYYRTKNASENGFNTAKEQRQMASIKLYYPQRWQGFAFETVRLAELVSLGLIFGMVLNVCCNILSGDCVSFWKLNTTQYLMWVLFSILVLKFVGRVNVLELRRLSPWFYKFGPSSACCTQAMLFPSGIIPELINYFQFNSSMNKDLAIHDYTIKSGHPGYQIEPNLFLHTGMHTSLAGKSHKDPQEFLFDIPFDIHLADIK